MLFAAMYGLINVLKFDESPQHQITYVNNFGEGLLHYAAKGNQEMMTAYLLLRGLNPNVENRFLETPIFIAAEMGSMNVLTLLVDFKQTKVDQTDKFGDNIMHFAARDGQYEVIEYLIAKFGKRLFRVKNQEGKTPLSLAI